MVTLPRPMAASKAVRVSHRSANASGIVAIRSKCDSLGHSKLRASLGTKGVGGGSHSLKLTTCRGGRI